MGRKPTLLKVLVQQRHLTFDTFRQDYEKAARELELGRLSIEARQYDRWLNGEIRTLPYPNACRVLERLFGRPARELFASAEEAGTSGPASVREDAEGDGPLPAWGRARSAEGRVSRHVRDDATTGFGARFSDADVERETVMAAAHESSEHAGAVESSALGATTVEQLHDDVTRLARSYVYAEPLPLVGGMVRVRDRVYRFLEHASHPSQQSDLLFFAGALCGLLASASFDLGYPDAATAQARSAWTYGHVIGHNELCGWADGMQATVAFWQGRGRKAVELIERGLETSPAGTARTRLCCIGARAWATLGNDEQVIRAVRQASRARETDQSAGDVHDSIGGQLGFTPARQAFCTGSAYVTTGEPDAAIRESWQALSFYEQSPEEERSYKAELGARADVAAACLLQADLERASETLEPVLTLSPPRRVTGLVKRLERTRRLLTEPPYRDSKDARELGERVATFTSHGATRALPTGTEHHG